MAKTMTKIRNMLPGTRFTIEGRPYRRLAETFPDSVSEDTWDLAKLGLDTIVEVSSDNWESAAAQTEKNFPDQP